MEDNAEKTRQVLSFKFTKKVEQKKLVDNKLDDELKESKESQDFVLSLEDKKIKSTAPKEDKKELIIPLIKNNEWRLSGDKHKTQDKSQKKDMKLEEDDDSLEALALKELLEDTNKEKEQWNDRSEKDDSFLIPLMMQNKVPEGYETDNKLDVSIRPDESTLENYEDIPVEEYGYAMLKGMGWKPGDPIGDKNRKCVDPIEVVLRPKGLGLGADKSVLEKLSKKNSKEEDVNLVKGAYVCIKQGPHKGLYGQVEGLDEDNARVVVRFAVSGNTTTLSELFVRPVSKKEYQKESKVINSDKYDVYKNDEKGGQQKSKHRDRNSDSSDKYYKTSKYESGDSSKNGVEAEYSSSKKRRHPEKRKYEEKHSPKHIENLSWVRSMLRVRFIDEKYKKGKYYNEKMIVEDVLSPDCIVCQTTDKNILEDIHPSMLETVIPRSEPSYVMIVQGKYKGLVGLVLKRDKTNCVATVQLLSNRDKILKLDYNSVCEYVGDISQFE